MNSVKKYYKTVLYILGIALLYYLMSSYGFSRIWEQIQEVSWYFGAIILVWLAVYILNAVSWSFIINSGSEKVSFSKVFGLVVSGYAINYITPFVSLGGEPYRIVKLKEQMPGDKAASLVLQYTMMHMYSHIWFWALGLIIMIAELGLLGTNAMIIGGSIVLIIAMFFFFNRLFKKGFLKKSYNFLLKVHLLNRLLKKYTHLEEKFIEIDRQVAVLYNNDKKAFYKSLIAEFASRIAGAIEILFILKALGVEISSSEAVYISAASSLIANIVFFMPMQLGVREGGLYFIIQTMALNPGLGIVISLVTRIREFFWIFIGFIIMPFLRKGNIRRGNI